MDNCEKKIKHLEMVEAIIARMGNNSFQLKGWAVTLVSIVGALSSQEANRKFFILAFIPLLAFWFLDAYYLQTERKFQILYRNICGKAEDQIDFSMDTDKIVCTGKEAHDICYLNCLIANVEIPFYGSIAVAMIILAIVLKVFK